VPGDGKLLLKCVGRNAASICCIFFFSVLNDEDPCLLMAIMLLIDRPGSEIMFEFNFWK
jgi:hypothetical protein